MARVKRGVTSHAKHKKTLDAAKGFYGRRKNTIRAAKAAVDRSMQYATRDRKAKKRSIRALWIQTSERRRARIRPDLFALHRRVEQGRRHDRPQGALRARDPSAAGLRRDRRQGESRAARRGLSRHLFCEPEARGPLPGPRASGSLAFGLKPGAWRSRRERPGRPRDAPVRRRCSPRGSRASSRCRKSCRRSARRGTAACGRVRSSRR